MFAVNAFPEGGRVLKMVNLGTGLMGSMKSLRRLCVWKRPRGRG